MIQYKKRDVRVFQSALFQTNSTVVQTEDIVLIVDPNWLPAEIEAIRKYVDKIKRGRPLFLLFTHSDYDHILGYGAFLEATVIASQAFVDNPGKEKAVQQILAWDDEYYIRRHYPVVYPEVDVVVEQDEQVLAIGGTKLTFYLAPGHTADCIFTLIDQAGVWLAGDYLCEVEFPFIYHSFLAYEETLAKTQTILASHNVRLLVPGHGAVAKGKKEILARQKQALKYLRRVRKSLLDGTPFNMEKLWNRYHFPLNMAQFHEENMALAKKELEEPSIT
jgi:glyoxylase-like metal-dependent hydrolase (beta-lactamase superfamily II)